MKKLILIVEDNESILFNMSLVLKLNNYEVLTSVNGKDSLDKLSTCATLPDLIISDILMPVMSGYELLEQIRKREKWKSIPFIFLSAKASIEEINYGKTLGATEYITKPINEELLLSLIKKILK